MMPQLIILPGLDGTGVRITPFLREMERVVPRAVIGYPPDRPMGYAELESLVRHSLPESERYVLLAESFSGPIAIRVAANPPPGLAGLDSLRHFREESLSVAASRARTGRAECRSSPCRAGCGRRSLGLRRSTARPAAAERASAVVAPRRSYDGACTRC
jgi:hypothetical protein